MARKPPRENTVLKACREVLALAGACVIRNNSGTIMSSYKGRSRPIRFGEPGSADLIACIRGMAVAVECKRPLGPRGGGPQPTEEQERWAGRWMHAGGYYFLCRSGEELEQKLIASGLWH